MTFKAGQSGNPKGRVPGTFNKRTQLAKLLEPHAEQLVARMIALALGGDVAAMRLCIERLIPKVQQEAIEVEIPTKINEKNISKLKDDLLHAVIEGKISVNDAEKLTTLISNRRSKPSSTATINVTGMSPTEAAKIYQEVMKGK